MDAPSFNDRAPEESALFQGSTLDLSGASKFYKRHSRIASQVCAHIKHVSGDKYELSPEILTDILAFPHMEVGKENTRPADRMPSKELKKTAYFMHLSSR